ncbi:MAG: thioredoxin fold domain-containing protein [Betaproteobacteria bacterium]|nr:thioredoxin fold domain-containing protein [Betaproteobacteria bacterium]
MNPVLRLLLVAGMTLLAAPLSLAQSIRPAEPYRHDADLPGWFKESFLDLSADIKEAAREKKRLMLYFGQDGCPYCAELMRVNFRQKDIVDKTRSRFEAIALNIWGDREVNWVDGKSYIEKDFAAALKVQFTPTLLFLDERGEVALRVNGYFPPHKFHAALDYASGKAPAGIRFADYLKTAAREPASGVLHDEPFFVKPPFDLRRSGKSAGRLLAVVFEQKDCAACDELHKDGFRNRDVAALVRKFDVARLALFGNAKVVTPQGKTLTEEEWGRGLNVGYTPSIVFFDAKGKEVHRIEAYLKPFHLASSFDYVASGAYLTQPSFQRFLQTRAEGIRSGGGQVNLW